VGAIIRHRDGIGDTGARGRRTLRLDGDGKICRRLRQILHYRGLQYVDLGRGVECKAVLSPADQIDSVQPVAGGAGSVHNDRSRLDEGVFIKRKHLVHLGGKDGFGNDPCLLQR
jgi:hypothetical protein